VFYQLINSNFQMFQRYFLVKLLEAPSSGSKPQIQLFSPSNKENESSAKVVVLERIIEIDVRTRKWIEFPHF
jgi:hypothetical protein